MNTEVPQHLKPCLQICDFNAEKICCSCLKLVNQNLKRNNFCSFELIYHVDLSSI